MSIGLSMTKADLDNRMATIFMGLRDNLRRSSELCAQLNDMTFFANDAALIALGYVQAEVTQLRAAFTDLGGTGTSLYRIATGAVAGPGSPNDFYFSAKHLAGVITS
jgi:hypothetical protein